MNAKTKKYWDEKIRFYKRDLKAGAFDINGDPEFDWDDKVAERTHETDSSATKAQYIAYVRAKMTPKGSKAPHAPKTAKVLHPAVQKVVAGKKKQGLLDRILGRCKC